MIKCLHRASFLVGVAHVICSFVCINTNNKMPLRNRFKLTYLFNKPTYLYFVFNSYTPSEYYVTPFDKSLDLTFRNN